MKKINWKGILKIFLWSQLAVLVFIMLAFVDKAEDSLPCSDLKINVDNAVNGSYFFESEDVQNLLNEKAIVTVGAPAGSINTGLIEKLLDANPYVQNSEVYMDIDGALHIEANQRTPVLRIFSLTGESFYLDKDGNKMPLSDKYSVRVLTASGNLNYSYLNMGVNPIKSLAGIDSADSHTIIDSLLFLANYISKNEFMNALTEQIFVNSENEFEIIPKIGKQNILVGNISNLDEKISKLILFYQKTMKNFEWEKYATINLKYQGQIVATKNPIKSITKPNS